MDKTAKLNDKPAEQNDKRGGKIERSNLPPRSFLFPPKALERCEVSDMFGASLTATAW